MQHGGQLLVALIVIAVLKFRLVPADYGLHWPQGKSYIWPAILWGSFFGVLMTAKSPSEVIELSSVHARKQFETLSEQSKELGALAQKVATETAEPMKSGMNKAFTKIG